METQRPLTNFFLAIKKDGRISITHIGLYAALLHHWEEQDFCNPITAFSHEIMKIAKISSPATYHKCIKDLSAFGYLLYDPSFKRNAASKIYLIYNT